MEPPQIRFYHISLTWWAMNIPCSRIRAPWTALVEYPDRLCRITSLCAVVLLGCQGETPELGDEWTDPSNHESSFVAVAAGVDLEVLDWGGSGPTMVFLPGLGNTAHAFDDFAPRFLDGFHVMAITRRGFGASSHPDSGYDYETLARDVIAVLDSKGIERAILLGHSIAAVELTTMGSEHPDRVQSLVFLDTYCTVPEVESLLISLFSAPPGRMMNPIQPSLVDTATVEGYVSFVHRSRGVDIPESDIRARYRFDGWDETAGAAYGLVFGAARGLGLSCTDVRVPSLAVIAQRTEISHEEPPLQADSALWPAYLEFQRGYGEIVRWMEDRFPEMIPDSRVVVIQGGHHWVFTSHADEVEGSIRDFLR